MASYKLCAAILVLSLVAFSAFADVAGDNCKPPSPKPKPAPSPSAEHCPKDALKLGVCADLLGLISVVIGTPPSGDKCCPLLKGLVDLEAAACLCIAIKANVLGINLNVPVTLSLLLSACQKTLPPGFQCA
ncbi:hypothetical protein L6164_015737 [Bauhinia variegata]|uniref:Uncharacterized protein n=1 Tax=Bauhinia variegata TaxID=167791 RepID=A0ACB9NLI1_BAUVA|nr:hypothetical protein L6164_015737 [Bauhinia variegata]